MRGVELKVRLMFLIVLAAVSLCGVLSAAASAAEPAFYECAKLKGGAYKDKLCSEPGAGKGKFELAEGIGAAHTFSGKIRTFGINSEEIEIECENSRISGELTSPTSFGNFRIELANCNRGSTDCGATVGHHKNVIEVGPLAGPIGYTSRELHTVAVALTPETGTSLAEYRCGGSGPPEFRLKGTIFGALSGNVNHFAKTFTVATTGPPNFEGGEPNPLEVEDIASSQRETVGVFGSPWGLKAKSALEIKA